MSTVPADAYGAKQVFGSRSEGAIASSRRSEGATVQCGDKSGHGSAGGLLSAAGEKSGRWLGLALWSRPGMFAVES